MGNVRKVREVSNAVAIARRWHAPAYAKGFIRHGVDAGEDVLLACRESARVQNANGNLRDQVAGNVRKLNQLGARVVAVRKRICSGKDPIWLAGIFALARRLKATVVFESMSRGLRHPDYHSKHNPTARPRLCDLRELLWVADGVPLATLADPDLPMEGKGGERAVQTTRGMKEKNQPGGRPRTELTPKAIRRRYLRLAVALRIDEVPWGQIRSIIQELHERDGYRKTIARSTVQHWIKRPEAVRKLELPEFRRSRFARETRAFFEV